MEFLQQWEIVLEQDWPSLREEWKSHCLNMGQAITLSLHPHSSPVTGQMIDIDDNGALLFRHPDGRQEPIHSGEILP
ncbi:MAG: hypothetical protein HC904_16345 [Blastochloris sp.]|nr:hypothetical protein [Blastochloris sp.]